MFSIHFSIQKYKSRLNTSLVNFSLKKVQIFLTLRIQKIHMIFLDPHTSQIIRKWHKFDGGPIGGTFPRERHYLRE